MPCTCDHPPRPLPPTWTPFQTLVLPDQGSRHRKPEPGIRLAVAGTCSVVPRISISESVISVYFIGWIGGIWDLWTNSFNLARFDKFGVSCLGGRKKNCVPVRKIRIVLARHGLGESHDQLSSSKNHLFAIILSWVLTQTLQKSGISGFFNRSIKRRY